MNRFFKFALVALPLAMLASCSDDDLAAGNENDIAKKTETRYLQVTLSSADALPTSRAEDPSIPNLEGDGTYTNGTKDENAIRTLDFYFYDKNKNFHSYVPLRIKDTSGGELDGDDDESGDLDPDGGVGVKDNIYGYYHCNVPVQLIQGEIYPRYVVCIVNAVKGSYYDGKSMAEAQATVLGSIYGAETGKDGKKYFGMSNSVYYGTDVVTGHANQLIMATPFALEALKTETELDKLKKEGKLEDVAVNIYVERYAAKVNIDLTETTIDSYTTNATVTGKGAFVTLNFTPKKWGVNAIEKEFFFIKAFRTIDSESVDKDGNFAGYGNDYESFATMDGILFNGWNNEDHHRCFWARTPGYYTNDYPVVTDDIIYNPTTNKYDEEQYDVKYITYNNGCTEISKEQTAYQYVNETTMMKDRLTGNNMSEQYLPTASLPSVLLAGQYAVVGDESADKHIDLYAYGKEDVTLTNGTKEARTVFYTGDADNDEGYRLGLGNIKDEMIDNQTIILEKTELQSNDIEGNTTTITTYPSHNAGTIEYLNLRDRFVVKHPSAEVRMATTATTTAQEANGGGVKVAADIVVLQIDSEKLTENDNLWFYNPTTTTYEKITVNNINIVNRLLLQNLGGAHLYKDGMAFFFAPIQHWGWYRTDNDIRPDYSGTSETNTNYGKDTSVPNPNKDKSMAEWDWTKMETGDFGVVRNHVYTMKIGKISGLGTGIKDPNEPIVPPAEKVGYEVHFHVNIQKWAMLPTQEWNW